MVRRLTITTLLLSSTLLFGAAQGAWLKSVPTQERVRINPYSGDENAVAAGAILYKRNCAACHGDEMQGIGKRPSLRTARVHDATDGELHWLLTNGVLAHGMPSWSRLPDDQRWQLTRFLHSLPVDATR